MQCPGTVSSHSFRLGVHYCNQLSAPIIHSTLKRYTYLKDRYKPTNDIAQNVCPDEYIESMVEFATPMHHEYSDIL